VSGILATFYADDAGIRDSADLISHAGADETCLHHTRLEARSPARVAIAEHPSGMLGGLETSPCPHTVLVKEVAGRLPSARECQVRVRGSTRRRGSIIVATVGAGVNVQSKRRDQGCRPMCSCAFHDAASQLYQHILSRLIPSASSQAAGSPAPHHYSWKNRSKSNAVSHFNRSYTARASLWTRTVQALPLPGCLSRRAKDF
jgi:hypothetical protein